MPAGRDLLVDLDVENNVEGWTVLAMDEPDFFQGESVLRSSICQDVSLEEVAEGQVLKLSGQMAVPPEDPSQMAVELGLSIYNADAKIISGTAKDGAWIQYMRSEQEVEREPVFHELFLDIPEGAAFARVSLTIYKKSTQNIFHCEELRLEETTPELASSEVSGTVLTLTNLNIPDDAILWNGHYYAYYDDAKISWTMAENYCSINNGHLAAITSAEEQAFLDSTFPAADGWIGASLREDGSWQWVTGEAFDYANWREGEPDNKNGTEGHAHLSAGMKWDDLPDEDTDHHGGYYCEWDSDTVIYEPAGLFGGSITEDTRRLLDEGKGYYYGTGPEGYDIGKAWECFASATDDHSAEAWYYLGEIMASGKKDTGKDPYVRAMGAYWKAALYGLSLGWMGQGDLYLNGQGVPVDYGRAMQLYQRAIDLGAAEANYGMGQLYQYGLGVEEDGAKAVEYYQKAAESEEYGLRNLARDALGNIYYEGCAGIMPDKSAAMNWYMAGAQDGYGPCCNNLGYMYYQGDGVDQDYSQAAYWFEMAASRGERDGCYNIAFLYENGTGVQQNYPLALEYYKKAALMGDTMAMYDLGRFYEEGLGIEKDNVLAREWYQKVLFSEDATADLKATVQERIAQIQSQESAALLNDPNYSQAWDYGAFGWDQAAAADWSASGWNPDGTAGYGSNQDASIDPGTSEADSVPITYGDDMMDIAAADPAQNDTGSIDSAGAEQGAAAIPDAAGMDQSAAIPDAAGADQSAAIPDAGALPQDGMTGTITEEFTD